MYNYGLKTERLLAILAIITLPTALIAGDRGQETPGLSGEEPKTAAKTIGKAAAKLYDQGDELGKQVTHGFKEERQKDIEHKEAGKNLRKCLTQKDYPALYRSAKASGNTASDEELAIYFLREAGYADWNKLSHEDKAWAITQIKAGQ